MIIDAHTHLISEKNKGQWRAWLASHPYITKKGLTAYYPKPINQTYMTLLKQMDQIGIDVSVITPWGFMRTDHIQQENDYISLCNEFF